MKVKYKQPIQLFLIFEKLNSFIWTSKKLNINHSIVILPSNWIYSINLFIKNELFSSNSILVEASSIDSSNYKSNTVFNENNLNFLISNNFILLYNYFNYYTKNKLTILYLLNKLKYNICSIDKIFPNANWLERELSEMYGIKYKWKNDTRKLLLDYIKLESPLLKEYQCEGYHDAFYSILDNQVINIKNETVEL